MKAELRLQPHRVTPGESVIEVWFAGELVATVAGAEAAGVRIISKYTLHTFKVENVRATPLSLVEVLVTKGPGRRVGG